jgi:hypothetical protein
VCRSEASRSKRSFSTTSALIQRGLSDKPDDQDEWLNDYRLEKTMDHSQHSPGGIRGFIATPAGVALLALLSAALIYALVAHTAHTLALLPYAFILLCPLMHLFMHSGHGGGENGGGKDQEHRH